MCGFSRWTFQTRERLSSAKPIQREPNTSISGALPDLAWGLLDPCSSIGGLISFRKKAKIRNVAESTTRRLTSGLAGVADVVNLYEFVSNFRGGGSLPSAYFTGFGVGPNFFNVRS